MSTATTAPVIATESVTPRWVVTFFGRVILYRPKLSPLYVTLQDAPASRKGARASGLKRKRVIPASDDEEPPAKKAKVVRGSFGGKKVSFEVISSDDDEPEESSPDPDEFLGEPVDHGEPEPDDSRCIICGHADCAGDCEEPVPELKRARPMHEVKAAAEVKREKNGQPARARWYMVTDFKTKDPKVYQKLVQEGQASYVVGQFEIAPGTKREHLQLYVEVPSAISFNSFKGRMPAGCHIEVRHGSQADAKKYCTKEESRKEGSAPFEFGTPATGSGKTSEQALAIEALKGGASIEQIMTEFPGAYARTSRGFKELAAHFAPKREDGKLIKALCLHGPPGGGKTTSAVNIAKELVASGKLFLMPYILRSSQPC